MEGILRAESRNKEIPITSMIQSMGVIPPEGLRRRGIHTTSIKANTEDIRWDGLRKSDVQEIMGGENSGDMRVSI